MKKLICTILAILSVITLCACGNTNSAGVVKADQPPTDEERSIISGYYHTMRELDTTTDEAKQAELYQELLAMDSYDKFIETEYASRAYLIQTRARLISSQYDKEISSWNRHEVLARFTVVEDKLLTVENKQIDNLGNESDFMQRLSLGYYSDGKVKCYSNNALLSPIDMNGHVTLTGNDVQHHYDEAGRLVKVTTSKYDAVDTVQTYTYDAKGGLTQMLAKNSYTEQLYTCTCDSQNRVTEIRWDTSDRTYSTLSYTYDAQGNVTEEIKCVYNDEVLDEKESFCHTYDANGNRTESVYTAETYKNTHWSLAPGFVSDRYTSESREDHYTYQYEGDKLTQVTVQHGSTVIYNTDGEIKSENDPRYVTDIYRLIYGNYGIYNAPEA